MDAIPSNLCTLVEQLEDSLRFHDGAAQQDTGDRRRRHREKSQAYAAMLAEIRDWQARVTQGVESPATATFGARNTAAPNTHLDDGYAALLDRVYRIHSGAAPVRPVVRMFATGNTVEGAAPNGLRARDRLRC